jgi:2-succinyl-6-hydroxy-2,4-cyclohexadiene-1-carboxylate synthase
MQVFLHGFTGDANFWHDVADADSLCLTLPGHDGVVPTIKTFDDALDVLEAQLPAFPVSIVGYSLGARLALGLMTRSPQRFLAVTLMSVHPGLVSYESRALRLQQDHLWTTLLREQGIEAFVDAWESQGVLQPIHATPMRLQAQRRSRLAHNAQALAVALEATSLGSMPNYAQKLYAISCPVQLITGAYDHKFCALARDLARNLSNAKHHMIENCGHNPVLEGQDLAVRTLIASLIA